MVADARDPRTPSSPLPNSASTLLDDRPAVHDLDPGIEESTGGNSPGIYRRPADLAFWRHSKPLVANGDGNCRPSI
ncbi:hypothetical protein BRADI_3g02803v3 [Brachypodium distachyon]|uniref:Uncharacterized protein n=1 Tax=Brachypodium distachyon TaxID=15368 RepID=A0A0Q3F3X3_BRADI|nr:hypothetical protein BRADI_3g02803v3 [Brachypodium distachyon]